MTFRERIMSIFRGEKVDRVLWQPRIEHWYNVNKDLGKLPGGYENKTILEIYDDLKSSVRYYGGPFLNFSYHNVRMTTKETSDNRTIVYETPHGTLREVHRIIEWGHSAHYSEYPVKTIEDMEIMRYVLEDTTVEFNDDNFFKADKEIGERGVVQFYYPRSPLQRLILNYMGLESAVYALIDFPREVKEFLKVIADSDDQLYDALCCSPVEVLNLGENIDANISSPPLFEEYLVPYYQKRIEQLHRAGKFCHIHMDGDLKLLLPYVKELGFDGIEAATPLPQGDVTLEELKEALGDKILLDGIPALLFLPQYSCGELEQFVSRVIEMFSPNLILGISDELPPSGDIEKVKLVSQMVDGN